MIKNYYMSLTLLVILLIIFPISILHSQEVGESILIDQPVYDDLYLAGRNIDVLSNIVGDIVAVGQRVIISGQVSRDVIAAGETVTINGTVQDDVRVAGRTVNVTSDVSGHIVAAGQSILIGPDSEIGDWAWLTGETVTITGTVNGDVKVAADTVIIDGEIDGDAELTGRDIRIGPRGVIHGNLSWRGPTTLDISEIAQIDGQINEMPFPQDWGDDEENGTGSFIFMVLSLITGAVILYLLLPGFSKEVANLLGTNPWKCLGIGIAVFLITPFASLLIIITAIGYLLGLALITAYLFSLIIGLLMGIIAVGIFGLRIANKYEASTRMTLIIAIVLTTIVIGLLWKLPYIGVLFFILIWIYGLGSVNLGLYHKYCNKIVSN